MPSANDSPAGASPRARPVLVPAELVPERRGAVAIMSEVVRDGDWALPRLFRTVALMGNAKLDLTRARIGPGTSHIEIVSLMANVTIHVPPEIRVECEGDPVMGSFEIKRRAESTAAADAPLVRITGTAFMASIVVVVAPGRAASG